MSLTSQPGHVALVGTISVPDETGPLLAAVLLLNGTDDAEVNAATNLTALEKGLKGNKRVSSRRLTGLNHWFQIPNSERIIAEGSTVDPVIAPVVLTTVRDWVLQQSSK